MGRVRVARRHDDVGSVACAIARQAGQVRPAVGVCVAISVGRAVGVAISRQTVKTRRIMGGAHGLVHNRRHHEVAHAVPHERSGKSVLYWTIGADGVVAGIHMRAGSQERRIAAVAALARRAHIDVKRLVIVVAHRPSVLDGRDGTRQNAHRPQLCSRIDALAHRVAPGRVHRHTRHILRTRARRRRKVETLAPRRHIHRIPVAVIVIGAESPDPYPVSGIGLQTRHNGRTARHRRVHRRASSHGDCRHLVPHRRIRALRQNQPRNGKASRRDILDMQIVDRGAVRNPLQHNIVQQNVARAPAHPERHVTAAAHIVQQRNHLRDKLVARIPHRLNLYKSACVEGVGHYPYIHLCLAAGRPVAHGKPHTQHTYRVGIFRHHKERPHHARTRHQVHAVAARVGVGRSGTGGRQSTVRNPRPARVNRRARTRTRGILKTIVIWKVVVSDDITRSAEHLLHPAAMRRTVGHTAQHQIVHRAGRKTIESIAVAVYRDGRASTERNDKGTATVRGRPAHMSRRLRNPADNKIAWQIGTDRAHTRNRIRQFKTLIRHRIVRAEMDSHHTRGGSETQRSRAPDFTQQRRAVCAVAVVETQPVAATLRMIRPRNRDVHTRSGRQNHISREVI